MSFAEDLIILKWILEYYLSWNIYLLNTFSELPVLHLLLICDVMHTTKPQCCNGAATLILWTLTETTCATATRNWLFPVGKFQREEHRKHGYADRKWDEFQWQKQVEVKWMMSWRYHPNDLWGDQETTHGGVSSSSWWNLIFIFFTMASLFLRVESRPLLQILLARRDEQKQPHHHLQLILLSVNDLKVHYANCKSRFI